MKENAFYPYQLEALLGDSIDDFDLDSIIDEVTYIDYKDGNKYWITTLEDEDIWNIIQRHDITMN